MTTASFGSHTLELNILHVDDSNEDLEVVRILLEGIQGLQIRPVNLVKDAMRVLVDESADIPDVILLDINMPGLNGIELMQMVRRIKHLDEVPVVVLSSSQDPREMDELKKLGVTDFIHKAFDLREYRKLLVEGLQRVATTA